MKYNRQAYKRYEFNVSHNTLLNKIIEIYKQDPNNNLSKLVRDCLCQYFGIDPMDADSIYFYYGKDGAHIIKPKFEKYLSPASSHSG